jgi:2,4-dienoyl-CoA reductase-like NADH-dependent reductase (Old Yellow Enzyme family)
MAVSTSAAFNLYGGFLMPAAYRKIASIKTFQAFLGHLDTLQISIPFDHTLEDGPAAPLAQPFDIPRPGGGAWRVANRFCILPMEGWDGTPDGHASDLTLRRWQRFGQSGAGLVWGGEAAAVRHDGRANPNQLVIRPDTLPDLVRLRAALLEPSPLHDGPLVGLQLTHSGRYSRPNEKTRPEPWIAYDHPWLNPRVGLPECNSGRALSDAALDDLVDDYARAAKLAQDAGFDFVDVKLCHGYLGHELLSAYERPGQYGGSLENRARFPLEIIRAIQTFAPGLAAGVRLSTFDMLPFRPGPDGTGVPDWRGGTEGTYPYAFGGDGTGLGIDLSEPIALLRLLMEAGVRMFCITAGSPYYNPHIQRPAYFPPSDGYQPPEDPLVGVARQVEAVRTLKNACPGAIFVGSAYSALQDWLPNVAQAAVREGAVDCVGLGRMVLAYPELPADVVAGRPLQRKRICRTFSDCTTAPRGGLPSGCYPLDDFYKDRPEAQTLEEKKRATKPFRP